MARQAPDPLIENVPLAPLTTLGVGGAARFVARCASAAELVEILRWARVGELPIFVLGGGSNLLVADAGFDGLVLQFEDHSITLEDRGAQALVRAGAGTDWDQLVARTVAAGLGGLECLSGIPGRVGAAPIQNVGAYGQEVAETLHGLEAVDLATGERHEIAAADCGFGYRQSRFKGPWRGRYAVTRVDFLLPWRRRGTVRYRDLQQRFEGAPEPSLEDVRRAVLEVRRSKSMVLDADDPNRRSAGSFFLNPVVTADEVETVRRRAAASPDKRPMPTFPAEGDRVKLSAAWLIEAAGFRRGYRRGRAGISSRHSLAIVNRGGATAAEIVDLAAEIRRKVGEKFGVRLHPEPVFLGFEAPVDELLGDHRDYNTEP